MKLLPNHKRAVIDVDKLKNYCLDLTHPIGKHKAKVLQSALSLTHEDAGRLAELMSSNITSQEAITGRKDEYGQRYFIDMKITNFEKEAVIRTVWIIENEESVPRFITCYLKK
jgi:hypothetical protein